MSVRSVSVACFALALFVLAGPARAQETSTDGAPTGDATQPSGVPATETPAAFPSSTQNASMLPQYVGMTAQDEGVLTRPRPEYDPKGIPMGGFRLFPELRLSEDYDSNVFRQPDGQDDFFTEAAPDVKLQSQWGRHFLEVYSGLDYDAYSRFSADNTLDWNVGSDGRLDISHAAEISAGGYFTQTHEAWSSPNNLPGLQAKPNRYDQTHGEITGVYQPSELGFGFGGSFDRYNWFNTPIIGGGPEINNADRDLDEYQAYAKAFYEFSPGYSAFLRGSYDSQQYDQAKDHNGYYRSSTGYRVDGGFDLQLTHLITGEIFGGYLTQDFDQHVPTPLPDVHGFNYGVNLNWYATPRLTIHLTGQRQLEDIVIAGASVSDNDSIGTSADFEILYDLIGQAHVQYTRGRFTGINRTDDMPDAGVGLKYLMNHYISVDLTYDWSQRSSNVPGVNFTDNLVSLGVKVHI